MLVKRPYSQNEKDLIVKSKKKSVHLAVLFLLNKKSIVINREDLYHYNGKFYEIISDFKLSKEIYNFFNDNNIVDTWSTNKEKEIIKLIKYNKKVKEVKIFNNYNHHIALNNGIYDAKKKKLKEHSSKYLFTSIANVDYDEGNRLAPHFIEFLKSLFNNNNSDNNELMFNICRIGGYLLSPQNKAKILFCFLGEGANGKSLLLDVYQLFFPEDVLTSMTLEELSINNFKRAPILNSRINIATETRGAKIDAEEIKRIISGEAINVDEKFAKVKRFVPNTKILIASNSRPYFNDTTHAIYRRLHFTEFQNRFISKEDYEKVKNPEKKKLYKQKNYEKMFNNFKKEKSAILNLFLAGYQDLKKRNWKFPETTNSKKIMKEYKESSDTKGQFLLDNYEIDNNNLLAISHIYKEMRMWYSINISEKPFNYSVIALGRKIKELFRIEPVVQYDKDENSKRICFTSYNLKEKEYDNTTINENIPSKGEYDNQKQAGFFENNL